MVSIKNLLARHVVNGIEEPVKNTLDGKTLFVGLGAMKTGTTWLSQYLKSHPEVYHSTLKEVNFFNTLVPNACRNNGPKRRLEILNQQILKYPTSKRIPLKARTKIFDIAEIGNFERSAERYLEFFRARSANCSVFGEISISYSTLPAEGFRKIAESHPDTRMFLIMRDPTARAVSHIQHKLRRQKDMDVDTSIEKIIPGNVVFDRSNYAKSLALIAEGAPHTPFMALVYEDLFTEKTIREFCTFLGIGFHQPDFSRKVNASRSLEFSQAQIERIRENLDSVYLQMADHFGDNRPEKWRWN